jgi:hypothetical protein
VPLFQPRYKVNIGNGLILKRPTIKSNGLDGQHAARWHKDAGPYRALGYLAC